MFSIESGFFGFVKIFIIILTSYTVSYTHLLDVSFLQENVLAPILGITDPKTDSRIGFVGGIKGPAELKRRVDSGEMAAAFAMYPVSVEAVSYTHLREIFHLDHQVHLPFDLNLSSRLRIRARRPDFADRTKHE